MVLPVSVRPARPGDGSGIADPAPSERGPEQEYGPAGKYADLIEEHQEQMKIRQCFKQFERF